MAVPHVKRNFKYGDLYISEANVLDSNKEDVVLSYEDLAAYKIGRDYLNFIYDNDFTIHLMYKFPDGDPQIAYTTLDTKDMYINGNYPTQIISSLLKHELGHFMIFGTDQPYSKDDYSVRSLIVKEVYSRFNLKKYSVEFLMHVENVIQDIIIETLNYPECVCETFHVYGLDKKGVKHQPYLDPISDVVKEALKNQLALAEDKRSYVDSEIAQKMKDFLEESLNDAIATMNGISDRYIKREAKDQLKSQITRVKNKITKKEDKLKELERLKNAGRPISDKLIEKVKNQLEELKDQISNEALKDELRRIVDRNKNRRDKEIAKLEETKKALQHNPGPPEHTDERDGDGHSCSTYIPSKDSIKISNKMYKMSYTKLKNKLFKLRQIESPKTFDKGMASDKDGNILTPKKENTYTRTSKLEYDNTDMLQGKKKKRSSGVSILIGLDVSGSMNSQWVSKFKDTVKLIKSVSKSLQIQEPVMFTYGDRLGTVSSSEHSIQEAIRERSGGGGNAFGKVYEQLIREAPLSTYTEIILVTDCGDNLGWDIQSPIKGVSEKELKMHCSVLDTDGMIADRPDQLWQKDKWSYYNTNNINMSSIAKNIAKTIRTNK